MSQAHKQYNTVSQADKQYNTVLPVWERES